MNCNNKTEKAGQTGLAQGGSMVAGESGLELIRGLINDYGYYSDYKTDAVAQNEAQELVELCADELAVARSVIENKNIADHLAPGLVELQEKFVKELEQELNQKNADMQAITEKMNQKLGEAFFVLKADAIKAYGFTDHPKADAAWDLAITLAKNEYNFDDQPNEKWRITMHYFNSIVMALNL